jgi:hypothetical protein
MIVYCGRLSVSYRDGKEYDFSHYKYKDIIKMAEHFAEKNNLQFHVKKEKITDSDGTDRYESVVFSWK